MISRGFVRTSVIVVVGNGLAALITVATIRIFTELAPKEVFGAANLMIGALGLGLQALVLPVTNMQLRFHTEAERAGRGDGFTGQILRWMLGASLALILVAAVVLMAMPGPESVSGRLLWLATASAWTVASGLRLVFLSRLHAEQRMTSYIAMRLAEVVLLLIFTAAAIWLSPTAEAFVGGQALALTCLLLGVAAAAPWKTFSLIAGPAGRGPSVDGFREKLKRYGAPFLPVAILSWLNNLADRYILTALLGAASTGQYVAAFSIASNGFLVAGGALATLFRPKLFDAEIAGNAKRARDIYLAWLGATAVIGIFGLAAIVVLGSWLVRLLLAADYRENAVPIMLWIGTSYFIVSLTQVVENRILSKGSSGRLLVSTAAGAAGSVVFSYVLTSLNGAIGAAQGNCIGSVLQFLVTLALLLRASVAPADPKDASEALG